jgi:hypothetical protein
VKRLVLLTAALGFVVVAIVRAAVPEPGIEWVKERASVNEPWSGAMLPFVYGKPGAETTYVADSSIAIPIGDARAASVCYRLRLYQGISGLPLDYDSCKVMYLIQWSADGDNWVTYDSIGVTASQIVDTLYHQQALTMRGYPWMRFISRPARPNIYMADSTGGGWQGLDLISLANPIVSFWSVQPQYYKESR